ncbi:Uncharacterised protein [Dermatophilus congolensis]|uniref:Uncharacterized protein n=1 Tax=Dermatophilus congolensis TaxID=1863 RepID=A0AA46H011_9MICO|nr:Uncharacterised protein [Dermatophilus congolensis]
MAECPDAAAIEQVLASGDEEQYPFDREVVARLWRRSAAQETTADEELIIRRVIWRAAFQDFLADLDGLPRCERTGGLPVQQAPDDAPDHNQPVNRMSRISKSLTVAKTAVRRSHLAKAVAASRLWRYYRSTWCGRMVRRMLATG